MLRKLTKPLFAKSTWIILLAGFLLYVSLSCLSKVTKKQKTADPETGSPEYLRFLGSTEPINYTNTHVERIRHLHDICREQENIPERPQRTVFYYSKPNNLSYCKVEKVGSTFWAQVFDIFKYGANFQEKAIAKSRTSVHIDAKIHEMDFYNTYRLKTNTIIMSRNPYTRLFSAYTDKVITETIQPLNLGYEIRKQLKPNDSLPPCQTNVTFEEFLKYIISFSKRGVSADPHWASINSLCKPCKANPFIILKQESFSKDVEYTFRHIGLDKETFNVLSEVLHDRRVETSISGVVKGVYATAKSGHLLKCIGWLKIAQRLWKTFQVQGYLHETLIFPLDAFGSDPNVSVANATYLTKVVLEHIRKLPMTSTDSHYQRNLALVNAYKKIPDNVIHGIQSLYKADFSLFDYNITRPK